MTKSMIEPDYDNIPDLNEVLEDPEIKEDRQDGIITVREMLATDYGPRPADWCDKCYNAPCECAELEEDWSGREHQAWQAYVANTKQKWEAEREAAKEWILAEYDRAIAERKACLANTKLTPDLAERIRRYIARMPDSIEGQNGSGALFDVCRTLVWSFGLSFYDAKPFAMEFAETRSEPPWNERDVVHAILAALTAEWSRIWL